MKTLKELNSKWYWRLIKIAYLLFLLLVMGISYEIISDNFKTYNPAIFEKYITENKSKYDRIINLRAKYPGSIIFQEVIKRDNISAWDLSTLYAMWKEIEGQLIVWFDNIYDKETCTQVFEEYLTGLQRNWKIEDFMIPTGSCGITSEENYNTRFKNAISLFDESTDVETRAKIYKDTTGEYIYKDFLSIFNIIKTLFLVLTIWFIFTFFVRSVIYYIIFGKVFPPKGNMSSEKEFMENFQYTKVDEKSTEKRRRFKKENILYISLGVLILIFQLHEFFFNPNYWMFLNGDGPLIAGHILATIIWAIVGIALIKKWFKSKNYK